MPISSFLPAFLIGLAGTVHCLGMCGGIAGAATLSLDAGIRARRLKLLAYVTLLNLGRVTSYLLAGLAAGLLGGLVTDAATLPGRALLLALAGLFLVANGLHLAGWLPRFAWIELLGARLWNRLEPLARRLLPVRSLAAAFSLGLVWGFLPCGMVYTALVYSASATPAPWAGAFSMLAFGLGTLPATLAASLVTATLAPAAVSPVRRRLSALLLVTLGLFTLSALLADPPPPVPNQGSHHHGYHP